MSAETKCAAVIVAAGNSQRMGFNKLLALIGGEPVLRVTLGMFERCDEVSEIILVAGDEVRKAVEGWRSHGVLEKLTHIVSGGTARHFSVNAGLEAVSEGCGIIAVHDGARPLISVEQIKRCIASARQRGAIASARRMTETLKRVDAQQCISGSIDREGVWIMETPQVFRREVILKAYEAVMRDGLCVTDEVSAVQHIGARVFVVENSEPNLKITLPGDIQLAEQFLS